MAEEAKNIRRTAKTRFTRKRNELLKSIENGSGAEIIHNNYASLADAWSIVESKHDLYIMYLKDEEVEAAEGWIIRLQELFSEATTLKMSYLNNLAAMEAEARANAEREQLERTERAKIERMIEQLSVKRDSAKAVFDTLYNSATHMLEADEIAASIVKKLQSQLDEALADCKQVNRALLELLTRTSAETEIEWFPKIQATYNEIIEKLEARINTPFSENDLIKNKSNHLRLEKIKMPTFDGEIKEYPQFKRDFQKHVLPTLDGDDASYVLRSCLGKEPLDTVKSVDDDITEMWKRLDDKYGDPAKVADVIIDSIRRSKVIREGEDKRFIEFVSALEAGYRDLKRLGLEAEITTTSSVSIIERKLPMEIRREWARIVSSDVVDKANKFPSLLKYLLSQKRAIEYDTAALRAHAMPGPSPKATVLHTAKECTDRKDNHLRTQPTPKCTFHDDAVHWTSDCKLYLSKPIEERRNMLTEKGACWSCLKRGHLLRDCKRKMQCGINGCNRRHHKSLHEDKQESSATGSANSCNNLNNDTCLLQLQRIWTTKGWVNVLWDNAASISFITKEKAKEQNLKGVKAELTITKVGGDSEKIISERYKLPLVDNQGHTIEFEVYGIDKITSNIKDVNLNEVKHLFKGVSKEEILRPSGSVDVLIGCEYAGFHPQTDQLAGHLLLLKNRFGRCLGGSHPSIKEAKSSHITDTRAHYVEKISIEDFYNIENLGIECTPRCGGCKCGKCPPGSKNYTLKEERELNLIERNLEYNEIDNTWITEYPWIKDPLDLPDNRRAALGRLYSTEKRLQRNPEHANVYQQQIQDMIIRGVARKLTKEELNTYQGPVHYVSHHEVLKPDSKSTPVRIVFNSSANYMGHVLNEYWAKGPDLLNNLLGMLIRFRENKIGFIGDVKKMYHTVKTKLTEQHTHRFLWRDMDFEREPDTYVIQRVSFGDRPSGTIATVAMRKTAERGKDNHPDAAKVIINNSYMDDIIDSVTSSHQAKALTEEIEKLLIKGGFHIKGWILSHDLINHDKCLALNASRAEITEKVLGITWSPFKDQFHFEVQLNFRLKRRGRNANENNKSTIEIPTEIPLKLTKRMILSQINRIYDPLGLAAPFTVRAKILMRQLWTSESKLGWDDPIPDSYKRSWTLFFADLSEMEAITFDRCIKPFDAIGNPTLVIFSDGSDSSYGACAYARWELPEGEYSSKLIMSKNRLAPNRKISIDRVELCGAILSKRIRAFLEKECRYQFTKCYHLVDSQIVYAMIQKESYGFNTFAATRIGEIQEGTSPDEWHWIESEHNIADWITRGRKPLEMNANSVWQNGPDFLKQSDTEWPMDNISKEQNLILPDQLKTATTANVIIKDTLAERIGIHKYSKYIKLIRITARVLAIYAHKPKASLRNAIQMLQPDDIARAELFWIHECQRPMMTDVKKGKYRRLCPRIREDETIVVGSRAHNWIEMSYNKQEVPLLPYHHPFSRLYAEYIHCKGHHGVATTVSKIRSRFWIVKLHRMVKTIRYNCVVCKRIDRRLNMQSMGKLPEERLKPSPPWQNTAIDLFGPFQIRGEVKKRTFGKCYGVIFNCMSTRAVHVDLAPDYSTEKFLLVLRRFVCLRGYPAKLYSDNGPQLVAANSELQSVTKGWNWETLQEFGATEGLQWDFTSADAPWQNGISEALVKSVKRAVTVSIGRNVLTFSELQTVCFEVANLVNERPIGRHPTSPEDGTYLCPNDLLLGRSTPRVPSGPFRETTNPRHRFEFVQNVVNAFWKKWTRDFFPSLLIRQKWHTAHRNVEVGDIVVIQDLNQVRGNWKLGRISQTHPGSDGQVRKVTVKYKNPKPGEHVKDYKGKGYVTVERPVNRLIVLVPANDKNDDKRS